MTDYNLILLALFIPFAATLVIPLFGSQPNLREGVTLISAVALFVTVVTILQKVE